MLAGKPSGQQRRTRTGSTSSFLGSSPRTIRGSTSERSGGAWLPWLSRCSALCVELRAVDNVVNVAGRGFLPDTTAATADSECACPTSSKMASDNGGWYNHGRPKCPRVTTAGAQQLGIRTFPTPSTKKAKSVIYRRQTSRPPSHSRICAHS